MEGAYTARAAIRFMEKYQVEMPITECVYRVLYEGLPVSEVQTALMGRDRKSEDLSADLLLQRYGVRWQE